MAQLLKDFSFIGRLGNITAYRMKGTDKIILRTRGGAKKSRIKRAPEFEPVRRNNAEFGGRSTASKLIMQVINPLKALCDYNIAGPLNALIKPIQVMDTENEPGRRNIYISRQPKLLEGFSFNKRNPFDSIIRNTVSYTLSKEEISATVSFPALIPGINFYSPPPAQSFYRLIAVLGSVADTMYGRHSYSPENDFSNVSKYRESEWYPVLQGSAAVDLTITLPKEWVPVSQNITMLVSVGICFGRPGSDGKMQQVPNAGAGKILAAVSS
jgi:hypothetical protein